MYQNGKIYKLVSDSTDKIYVGSTCNPLYKRINQHRQDYKRNRTISSKEIIKFEDCKIILIEDFACERKEQLTARERYWIEQNKNICVNMKIPTRTDNEYYKQNKDKLLEQSKEYREQNKDNIREQRKEFYKQNKDKILAKNKDYREQNKDKIKEQKKTKIICQCGCKFAKPNINRHCKSIKHIKWIEQNQNPNQS